jgi:hypothetical protein
MYLELVWRYTSVHTDRYIDTGFRVPPQVQCHSGYPTIYFLSPEMNHLRVDFREFPSVYHLNSTCVFVVCGTGLRILVWISVENKLPGWVVNHFMRHLFRHHTAAATYFCLFPLFFHFFFTCFPQNVWELWELVVWHTQTVLSYLLTL